MKWIVVLIIGIIIGVTFQHYFDYEKTMKYYDTIMERSKQETARLNQYVKTIKKEVDKAVD